MRAFVVFAAIALSLLAPIEPLAKGGSSSGLYSARTAIGAPGPQRDASGHIARSGQAKTAFKKANPCPSTGKPYGSCPGYVIDHVLPLKRGGADAPYNMQWQTIEQARIKDKWE
jgi:hypothetical protein